MEVLEFYWTDTCKARELGADGIYKRLAGYKNAAPVNVQNELLSRA